MGIETLAIASLASSVAGSAIGAGASIIGGMNKQNMYNYQAAVADINATRARQIGETEAFNSQLKTGGLLGKEKATQAASGVDVNSGSAVDVRASTAELGRLDAETILNNADTKALGLRQQAEMDRLAGKNAMTEGVLGAVGNVLGGASSVGDKWLKYKAYGVFQ
jgi:hypothetical protein